MSTAMVARQMAAVTNRLDAVDVTSISKAKAA